jgi:hypothetical protein
MSLAELMEEKIGPSPMLQKCANPACTVPFRSLRDGRLFVAEAYPADLGDGFDGNRRKLRRREHFWLCDACASHFTLRFDTMEGMVTVPILKRAGMGLLEHAAR